MSSLAPRRLTLPKRKSATPATQNGKPTAPNTKAIAVAGRTLRTKSAPSSQGECSTCYLTFEFTRVRKRAKPAEALRVQRRVRRCLLHFGHALRALLEGNGCSLQFTALWSTCVENVATKPAANKGTSLNGDQMSSAKSDFPLRPNQRKYA